MEGEVPKNLPRRTDARLRAAVRISDNLSPVNNNSVNSAPGRYPGFLDHFPQSVTWLLHQ